MKYKNIKPDLLNGSKQFRFLFRKIKINDINDINNINNINNNKKDIKNNNYDTSFYLNLYLLHLPSRQESGDSQSPPLR